MSEITADIIKESTIRENNNYLGILTYKQIDRTYLVQGASTTASNVSAQAINAVKSLVPPTSAHPVEALCIARNYAFHPSGNDDGGNVVVSYIYEVAANYIESDGGVVQEMGDFEYFLNGSGVWTRRPIIVKYNPNQKIDPTTGAVVGNTDNQRFRNGNIPITRATMGLTFSQIIYDYEQYKTILAARRTHLNRVNSATFSGDDPYYWKCDAIIGRMSPYAGNYTANVHLSYKEEGWYEWVRYEDGKPLDLWRYDGTGAENPNGYYKSTPSKTADMNYLIGLLGMVAP